MAEADLPPRSLISADFLQPGCHGQVRVLLTCSCGKVTDYTFEAGRCW